MNRALLVDLVQRLPQGVISRGWGWLARRRRPRVFVEAFKRGFVRATGIDMAEAAAPIGSYETLEDLFVRPLRAGARRIDPDPAAVVSPVDGTVGACGEVTSGTLLQVKGRDYRLAALLGDEAMAERFEGGPYATLYLAPDDYHRVHAPVSGEIREATLIPGALLPVFTESVERLDEVFARNERLISYIDSPDVGRVAVVKVGATLVGRITTSYDAGIQTNRRGQARQHLSYDPPRLMNKGGELGRFELGSTVVLVGEPDKLNFAGLVPGARTRVGERIGSIALRGRQVLGKGLGSAGARGARATRTSRTPRAPKRRS